MSSGDQPILTLKFSVLCFPQHKGRYIFKQKGPSCEKKELHLNSTSSSFQSNYKNFD